MTRDPTKVRVSTRSELALLGRHSRSRPLRILSAHRASQRPSAAQLLTHKFVRNAKRQPDALADRFAQYEKWRSKGGDSDSDEDPDDIDDLERCVVQTIPALPGSLQGAEEGGHGRPPLWSGGGRQRVPPRRH